MIPPLTRAEVEALPVADPWHVGCCPDHSPGGLHYCPEQPAPTCLAVRDQQGRPVIDRVYPARRALDLQAAAPCLRATALALHKQVEEACHGIAAILDRDQIEPLPASVDRLICALADARERLEVYEAGGSWPSDLGEPLRCGTLAALASPPQTGILEWRDGLPVRPTQQEKT